MGDRVVPGRSELPVPVAKDEEVHTLCLMEGIPSDDSGEDLRVAPGVGAGTEVVHWVRVANWGPDPLTIHKDKWWGCGKEWRRDHRTPPS